MIRSWLYDGQLRWNRVGTQSQTLCDSRRKESPSAHVHTATSLLLFRCNDTSIIFKRLRQYCDVLQLLDHISIADHARSESCRSGEHPSNDHTWIYTPWRNMKNCRVRKAIQMSRTHGNRPWQQLQCMMQRRKRQMVREEREERMKMGTTNNNISERNR